MMWEPFFVRISLSYYRVEVNNLKKVSNENCCVGFNTLLYNN